MKHFNERIREKINSYEYPYDEGSWELLLRKMKLKKILRRGLVSVFVGSVILSSFLLLNNLNQNTDKSLSISNVSTNNKDESIVKVEKNYLNNNTKENEQIVKKSHLSNLKTENNANTSLYENDASEYINDNFQDSLEHNAQIIDTSISKIVSVKFKKSVSKGCVPLEVQFTNLSSDENVVMYLWDFGDGTVSYELNPIHEYQKAGKYKVRLTAKNIKGEYFSSEIEEIVVYDKPLANFEYKIENNCIALFNTSKKSSFVKWEINDTIDMKEYTNYCINKSGKYTLSLIVENNYGCRDTMTKLIDLLYKLPVNFANAITPDGDGNNDVFGPIVSDYTQYKFKMFIYNKQGKCIFEQQGSPVYWDGTYQNNKQPCPADIYFYRVIAIDNLGNKNEFSGKINLKR